MPDATLHGSHFIDLGASTPTATPTHPNKEYVAGTAQIAYHSITDDYDVTVAASSETVDGPVENLADRLTDSFWQASAGGTQTVTIESFSGKTVNYLGLAAHNLASLGASIIFQDSHDGITWTTLAAHAPATDGPILLTFDDSLRRWWRLSISSVDAPLIGVLMLGEMLPLQRGIYVGHAPASYNRDVTYLTDESEGGHIVGRAVLSRANTTSVPLRHITPAWFRSDMWPFLEEAEESPFFFRWNTDERYQREVFYGVLTVPPRPFNDKKNFMAVDLSMRGLA